MSERIDARVISERLADRIATLALLLLRSGHYGPGRRHWRCGSVAGEPGQSLCVWLVGPRRGRWRDYAAGAGGDALDLVAEVACGGNLGAAIKWARDWLGLGRLAPEEAARLKTQAERARAQHQCQAEREACANAQDAKRVWLAGAPLGPDDFAWRYFAGRGIDLDALPQPPAALRLHPALYNAESRRAWPAVVAAICAGDGRHVNTQRIWLGSRADGSVGKAPLHDPKLSMPGGYPGGCVRLWRGASGKPWNAMPDGETLLAGEGIEDVLAIVCARPEWRACAVLSVSNLSGLVLPPQVGKVIWIAQNDPPGSPAARALTSAIAEHRKQGRRLAVIRPPSWVKDVAELAQRQLAEEAA